MEHNVICKLFCSCLNRAHNLYDFLFLDISGVGKYNVYISNNNASFQLDVNDMGTICRLVK